MEVKNEDLRDNLCKTEKKVVFKVSVNCFNFICPACHCCDGSFNVYRHPYSEYQ